MRGDGGYRDGALDAICECYGGDEGAEKGVTVGCRAEEGLEECHSAGSLMVIVELDYLEFSDIVDSVLTCLYILAQRSATVRVPSDVAFHMLRA